MQAIGLRLRYFITILIVLTAVIVTVTFLYSHLLLHERLAFVDQQVRETAAALVDSELNDLRKIDFEEAETIISDELGETRIGKFFIIRNPQGEIVYESVSAQVLESLDLSGDNQWFQFESEGKFIRGLNLQLPRIPDRTLQVGLVIDKEILSPQFFTPATLTFIALSFVLGLVISYFLTSFLLMPISLLEKFLRQVTSESNFKSVLPMVPVSIVKRPNSDSRDELVRLVNSLNHMIERINKNYLFSRHWAYQMAHELKTPLSIVSFELESLQKRHSISVEEFDEMRAEIGRISETIGSFLGWAELENLGNQKNLFAIKISQAIQEVKERNSWADIPVELKEDFVVAANKSHLEQLLQNLLSNAIKYSPRHSIRIEVAKGEITVMDGGPGIPQEVLQRMGEPFNRGETLSKKVSGHGLGLAWVSSICRLYDWQFSAKHSKQGARIHIRFGSAFE